MSVGELILFAVIFSIIRSLLGCLIDRFFPWGTEEDTQEPEEEMIFKAYSRALLRDLMAQKEALVSKDYAEAEKILDNLIEDTKKGIEN